MQSAGLELDAEPLAESALAAAGRSRDQHHPDGVLLPAALVYLLGDLHDLLFLKGFGDQYEVGGLAFQAGVVHVAYGVEVHDAVPPDGLGEDLEGLGLFVERGQPFRVVPVGNPQYHAAAIRSQAPYLQVAGTRHERIAVVVRGFSESIVFDVYVPAGLHELDLVVLSAAAEHSGGLGDLDLMAPERQIELHELLHPAAYGGYVVFPQGAAVRLVDAAEIAFGYRPAQAHATAREEVVGGLAEQEAERAAVDVASAVAAVVHEFYVLVVEDFEHQPLGDVVHLRREYVAGSVEVEGGKHFEQGGALGEFLVAARVPAVYP